MKTSLYSALLALAGAAEAHVADHLSPAEHASEHLWFALALIPIALLLIPLLRRKR